MLSRKPILNNRLTTFFRKCLRREIILKMISRSSHKKKLNLICHFCFFFCIQHTMRVHLCVRAEEIIKAKPIVSYKNGFMYFKLKNKTIYVQTSGFSFNLFVDSNTPNVLDEFSINLAWYPKINLKLTAFLKKILSFL